MSVIWYIIDNYSMNIYNSTRVIIMKNDKDTSTNLRATAIRLRLESRYSYSRIRQELGVSKSTLSYWLKEFPLTKAEILKLQKDGWSKAEAGYEKYRRTMGELRARKEVVVKNEFLNRFKSISDNELFIAGLMIYYAEGDKKNQNRIVLANTDYRMIKFFINWQKRFLQIEDNKFKVQLHLYENMNIKTEFEFWQNKLNIPKNQFYKIQIRPNKVNSFSYSESYRHGTCSLFVLNSEKKMKLMAAIDAFLQSQIRAYSSVG